MGGGRRAKRVSDRDEKEDTEYEAFRHADQHSQSGVNVHESRPIEKGRRAVYASKGDEKKSARRGVSRHAE